jgi:hypothetical protein
MKTLGSDNAGLDHALNEALINANISSSYEEFFDLFDRFYEENVEVVSDASKTSIVGKKHLIPILFGFLMPLHVMAEIGAVAVKLHYVPLRTDQRHEFFAEWNLDLTGVQGRKVTVNWLSVRRWKGRRVIYERHTEHRQTGEPLTSIDLHLEKSEAS